MPLVEESALRFHGLWILYALIVVPFLISPTMGGVGTAFVGAIFVSWIQSRRTRAAVVIEEDDLLVVNRYETHRVPMRGASVRIGMDRLYPASGTNDIDDAVAPAKLVYIVPKGGTVDDVHVDAMRGLFPKEFHRVVTELRSVIAMRN